MGNKWAIYWGAIGEKLKIRHQLSTNDAIYVLTITMST
jgi:hypothetical protein